MQHGALKRKSQQQAEQSEDCSFDDSNLSAGMNSGVLA
jgi:hypothetical protein